MVARVRDGEIIGNDAEQTSNNKWKIIDRVSGDEEEFSAEPTRAQVLRFKADCGYTTIKVKKDERCKTITVSPIDKSGIGVDTETVYYL
jgi:hypothetical protein